MCLPAALFLGNLPLRKTGEAPGRRLWHWGRAALELRQARRGSARIPLRGNPGSACTSKAPGKVSREPGSAATRVFLGSLKMTNKAAGSAGGTTSAQEQGKSPSLPQSSDSILQNLMERIQTLEETVGGMKEELKHHKDEIQGLNEKEQGLQVRIEQLENYSCRNNIKLLKVPEGAEGANLKSYVVSLIKSVCELEESNEEIEKDIQRVHRDPFTRRPNSTRPRKILVNFLTYHLKEKILTSALKQKSLRMENVTFEIRSDLSKITMDRQWELGKRLDEFKKLGVMAQLKFPAFLRIMHNNKMYNIREIDRADELLDVIRKEQADHV
ncbi:hypothetical protein NDU88_005440 [Pleurodeles waltl]|uniref:L1 transposable element RRM domain-containing protein n=1 Tax=Pleurodeles waltl TaxID=8319 RepID=A0AAV7SLL8_PLEWA|nr:hypothetical protein NDU88_005440 [Pleurodeles waltl]